MWSVLFITFYQAILVSVWLATDELKLKLLIKVVFASLPHYKAQFPSFYTIFFKRESLNPHSRWDWGLSMAGRRIYYLRFFYMEVCFFFPFYLFTQSLFIAVSLIYVYFIIWVIMQSHIDFIAQITLYLIICSFINYSFKKHILQYIFLQSGISPIFWRFLQC